MIVVDVPLIACLCIDGESTRRAELVLQADPAWAAPAWWRSEFAEVLAGYLRRRRMDMEAVLVSLHMAEETVGGREYVVDTRRVLELSAQSGCGAFECEYVALALDLAAPLVTMNKLLVRAFPKTAVTPEKFTKKK